MKDKNATNRELNLTLQMIAAAYAFEMYYCMLLEK